MKSKLLLIGAGVLSVVAFSAIADIVVPSKTFRTVGVFLGVTQGTNSTTGYPKFDEVTFAGHHLVNLAMGRTAGDTNYPNQVMAMTVDCDLSTAQLVVYDKSVSNVVATIAHSTSMTVVKQQGTNQPAPNRARFVAQFDVDANGNAQDGLVDGFFTVAGRLHLDPTTGCPQPVLVSVDNDPLDRFFGDKEIINRLDPDSDKLVKRTGLAHLIGVVNAVTDGSTNTVLVPYGGLSIRRVLQ